MFVKDIMQLSKEERKRLWAQYKAKHPAWQGQFWCITPAQETRLTAIEARATRIREELATTLATA